MRIKLVCAVSLALLVTVFITSYAQSGLAGKWTGKEGKGFTWSMELTVKGDVLTGTRTVTFTGGQQPCEIKEGKIEGRLFSFSCELTAPDGGNPTTATFEGFINKSGNQITVSPQGDTSGGPVMLTRK